MRNFLQRLSSRKFLTALAVQAAAVVALFWPQHASAAGEMAIRIAALVTLLLAALGYGSIESAVDAANTDAAEDATDTTVESKEY